MKSDWKLDQRIFKLKKYSRKKNIYADLNVCNEAVYLNYKFGDDVLNIFFVNLSNSILIVLFICLFSFLLI